MNDKFTDEIIKNNKVKDYNEVKDTDPYLLEDNCPEFYVGENIDSYNEYDIGDIVFVKNYNYNSGKKGYNHLFVIIGKNNYVLPLEFFCMLISSKIDKVKFKTNIIIKKNNKNNLVKDSIVKTDEIYKINKDQIVSYIGKIDNNLIETFKRMYKDAYEQE